MSKKRIGFGHTGFSERDVSFAAGLLGRGASRREALRILMAGGAGLAAATALLGRASDAMAATPKRGGHYRVGIHEGNTTDTLNPALTNGVCMIQVNHTNRNFLTEIDEFNSVAPDIAEGWEALDGATRWVFKLRRGVEFHNGKPFTAADAVASLNYHRKEGSESAAKPLLAGITDIRADGDETVVFTLESANADLPYILSDYHLVMMPSDSDGNVDASGVGTGPYILEKFEPGVQVSLTRNPNYFKEGRAHFDAVTFQVLNDPNARLTALLTGEIDVNSQIEAKSIRFLERDDRVVIDNVPSGAHATMPMHVDSPPFDDMNVRLALKHAIDREEIVEKVLGGAGVVGNDHPIGPTVPYWSDIGQRSFDPDKAKFHLKQAGLDGLKVQLSASDAAFPGALDMATLFQASAKKAGIDVEVAREAADGYWSDVWLKKPFIVASWGARPTPDVMFSLAYQGGAAWNESKWDNPNFNKLLLEARSELDDAKRGALYAEMMTLCRDEGGTIVPFFTNRVSARRKEVMHSGNLTGNWQLDGARSAERWWFG